MAVSVLYYLHDRESQPDFLFLWLFYLLQRQNGNVRYAATRMLENELGPLTVHIRCPDEKFGNLLKQEQADLILLNLFITLNNLLAELWKPAFKNINMFHLCLSVHTKQFKRFYAEWQMIAVKNIWSN